MRMIRKMACVIVLGWIAGHCARAATLSPAEDGVHIDGDSMGNFTLSYPSRFGATMRFRSIWPT